MLYDEFFYTDEIERESIRLTIEIAKTLAVIVFGLLAVAVVG